MIDIAPPTAILDAVNRWHRFMAGELPDALHDFLADDAVMYSPSCSPPSAAR